MLTQRLISSAGLIAFLVTVSFWAAPAAQVLCLVGCELLLIGAIREYFMLMRAMGAGGYPRLVLVAGVLHVLLLAVPVLLPAVPPTYTTLVHDFVIPLALLMAALLLACRTPDLAQGIRHLVVTLAAYGVLVWPLCFLPRLYFWPAPAQLLLGPHFFFFLVLVTKSGDIGGYVVGKLTASGPRGNHKMTPRLSPKKSWEGLAGTIGFSVLVALAVNHWLPPLCLADGRVLLGPLGAGLWGVALAFLGLAGDLSESALKRASGLKDSGSILPGMGGVLDALDSLLLAAPCFYLYLRWVAL